MNICILGAGAWGTAMALHLLRGGHSVSLVTRRIEQALDLAYEKENRDYLPGFTLPADLQIGHEVKPVLMEAAVVLLASPSHGIRDWADAVRAGLDSARQLKAVVSLSKGLEVETLLRPSEILAAALPDLPRGALAGPTFATEVARGAPTAMVLAGSGGEELWRSLQEAFSSPSLRIYRSPDLAGVELGGCLKNIYAIAAGCCDGLKLGDNARAALVTRMLAEMVRLGEALGASPDTFHGLSGVGDLVATCYGDWSRNHGFGQRIGAGEPVKNLIEGRKTVVEGYRTTLAFHRLCRQRDLAAPVLEQVHAILYEDRSPREALAELMNRRLREE
ncbi:MAG: NAD(P)-dependent glycerol-3-phosphate dehydrogenase [Puniceicoccaceae bacterium]|nr:MAG: NAD(P)-dependent glycerol-3-phosphate dehydrogenase [Puniceicoccaceae bacterium]